MLNARVLPPKRAGRWRLSERRLEALEREVWSVEWNNKSATTDRFYRRDFFFVIFKNERKKNRETVLVYERPVENSLENFFRIIEPVSTRVFHGTVRRPTAGKTNFRLGFKVMKQRQL